MPKLIACLLLLAAPAASAQSNAAHSNGARSNKGWEAGFASSYVRGGSFDGFGVTATYSWLPSDYLAFGPVLDLAALGGGGKSGNGLGSSYSFLSTFIGPSLQLRLPVGAFLPYADVGIGYLGVFQVRSSNTQCDYGAGFGARLGVGLNAAVSALRVGVRGSARQAGGALSCAAVFGPATFDASLLFALGATADYRW